MAGSGEDASWTEEHGRALRDRRHRQGFSQEALAEAAGVDRRTLSSLEQGRRQPRYGTIHAIAEALGCDSKDLLQLESGPAELTAEQILWRQAAAGRGSRSGREQPALVEGLSSFPAAPPARVTVDSSDGKRERRHDARRRRGWLIALGLLATVVVATGVAFIALQTSHPPDLDPHLVAVTVFENATGDASLDPIGRLASEWIAQQVSEFGLAPPVATTAVVANRRGRQPARGVQAAAARLTELARGTGAGVIVWGAYHRRGRSLDIVAEIHDIARGRLIHAVPLTSGPLDEPLAAIEAMGERLLGALAAHYDFVIPGPHLAPPPTFSAYREFRAGVASYALDARGWYAASPDDAQATIEHLERALEIAPTFATPRFLLFDLYLYVLRDRARADSCLAVIHRDFDGLTPFEQLKAKAWTCKLERNIPEALGVFRQMHEMDPHDQATCLWAGIVARYANRPREAIAMLEGLDPEFRHANWGGSTCLYQLCCAYHMLGEHDRELETSAAYVQLRPEGVFPVFVSLAAQAALGRIEDVRQTMDRYLALPKRDPSEVRVVYSKAVGELRWHGHEDAAAQLASEAVEYYSQRPAEQATSRLNRLNLARCLYLAERWDEARALFEELAAETPQSSPYRAELGVLAVRRGDRVEATRILEELHRDGATRSCARIAALLGNRQRAVDWLREAHEQGPSPDWMHADMDFESLRGFPPFEELLRPKG
jgi:transcriptional regulator with XRE-family HTH domain/tetratricopeptide (TPR) repeat protein